MQHDLKNEIKHFILSLNEKFVDNCNLSYNKLEYIALVEEVEEKYDIILSDDVLNSIVEVQDLVEQVSIAIMQKNT